MSVTHSLQDMILNGVSAEELEAHLNALSDEARAEACVALTPKAQRGLWRLCEGRAVTLEQLVPADRAPYEQVRHIGRNTLPAFKRFEKRFCRVEGDSEVLWGYNEGSTRALVGPGYFVCHLTDDALKGPNPAGGVVINYERRPTQAPEGWPAFKPNESGLSRFVYAHMHDYLRRVSEHVTIGLAYRHGKESPNYFVLCRER